MKDEHDKYTADFEPLEQGEVVPGAGTPRLAPASKEPKPFQVFRAKQDEQSTFAPRPKCARLVSAPGMYGGNYVPVAFAAKDWKVSPRRIRFLLAGGRLFGRLLENGYWEVAFPYQFTMGTRGPGLKRHQRPPDKPKNPEAIQERQP